MKLKLYILVLLITSTSNAQDFIAQDLIISNYIEGTLLQPNKKTETLVIIIPGDGPTDRDGNQNFQKNNSLKFLAQDITQNGIASFRFDKRVLTMLKKGANINEIKKVTFNDFISDAKKVVTYFNTRKQFKNIYVLGHSQGALVGMLASRENVRGFISIGGLGNSADIMIMDQLKGMNVQESMLQDAQKTFNILKEGKIDKDFNINLANFFSLEVQPFMISWIKHNPNNIIANLKIPTLLINGDKDIQVPNSEAKLLKEHKKDAELLIIKNMNHVFKTIESNNQQENMKLYNMPQVKNTPELITSIITFIKK